MKTKLILGGLLAFSLAASAQLPAGTTCEHQGQELIINGDFNSGNTGFTSGYTYVSGCASGGIHGDGATINTYNVNAITTCYPGHTDRTTGNGNVIHFPDVQAASAGVVMWAETLNVLPGKIYNLSLWAYEPTGNCPYQLPGTRFKIYINNILIQPDSVGGCGSWNNKNYYWSSGTSITAAIEIRTGTANFNSGYAGMDVLFDGISFKECLPPPPCEKISGTELITNGDFNGGNTGFTSGFTYVSNCSIPLNGGVPTFNTYNIDPLTGCYGITDHLGLNGNAMHFPDIQGGNIGQVFWQHATIAVTSGNNYVLSLWVYEPYGNCPVQAQGTNFDVYINTMPVAADNVGGCGVWSLKYYYWNATTSTADIEIRNATSGNYNDSKGYGMDLLLDDISFKECREDREDPENPDGHILATGLKNSKAPSQPNLSIMPNPGSGSTVLKSSADMEIKITNELGQVVRTVNLNAKNNHTERLDNLSEGVYFVNSSSGYGFTTQKLVITK